LKGTLSQASPELNQWTSYLKYGSGESSQYFLDSGSITVSDDGTFTVFLPVDTVMTITTLTGQRKGSYSSIPPSAPFPVPYSDDFDSYPDYGEAQYFADQSGVFEIRSATDPTHGKVMTQVVPERPITWCDDADQPNTLIGNITWTDVEVQVSVLLEAGETAVFLGARMSQGGCGVAKASGVFLWLDSRGFLNITSDLAGENQLSSQKFAVELNEWYTLGLDSEGSEVVGTVKGNSSISTMAQVKQQSGYVAMGTGGFYSAQFDNFSLSKAS
jgi:galactosylceramidase